jgi:hypothetical protein
VAIKLAVTLALTYVLSHELPLLPHLLPYASKEREVERIDLETGEKVVELTGCCFSFPSKLMAEQG